jgi:hypothetical protein
LDSSHGGAAWFDGDEVAVLPDEVIGGAVEEADVDSITPALIPACKFSRYPGKTLERTNTPRLIDK